MMWAKKLLPKKISLNKTIEYPELRYQDQTRSENRKDQVQISAPY